MIVPKSVLVIGLQDRWWPMIEGQLASRTNDPLVSRGKGPTTDTYLDIIISASVTIYSKANTDHWEEGKGSWEGEGKGGDSCCARARPRLDRYNSSLPQWNEATQAEERAEAGGRTEHEGTPGRQNDGKLKHATSACWMMMMIGAPLFKVRAMQSNSCLLSGTFIREIWRHFFSAKSKHIYVVLSYLQLSFFLPGKRSCHIEFFAILSGQGWFCLIRYGHGNHHALYMYYEFQS